MNTETNISPAPVRRQCDLSNPLASGRGGELEVAMTGYQEAMAEAHAQAEAAVRQYNNARTAEERRAAETAIRESEKACADAYAAWEIQSEPVSSDPQPSVALTPFHGGLQERQRRETDPHREGWGALSGPVAYKEGESIEVLFPEGWRSGVFLGFVAGGVDEDFQRMDVRLAEPGRVARGCHPDCVRRPFSPENTLWHTPGPWVAVGNEVHDKATLFDERGARMGETPNRIAVVEYPYGEVDYAHDATKEANARLIAAAPELADALEAARRDLYGYPYADLSSSARRVRDQIDAALRKAGRS